MNRDVNMIGGLGLLAVAVSVLAVIGIIVDWVER